MNILDAVREFPIDEEVPRKMLAQAEELLAQEKVELLDIDDEVGHLHVYHLQEQCIHIDISDGYLDRDCDCRTARSGYYCRHIVAASLFLERYDGTAASIQPQAAGMPTQWRRKLDYAMMQAKTRQSTTRSHPYLLLFSLQKSTARYYGSSTYELKPYKLKVSELPAHLQKRESFNPVSLANLIENNSRIGNSATAAKSGLNASACINASPALVDFVNAILKRGGYNYYYSESASMLEQIHALRALDAQIFYSEDDSSLGLPLTVLDDIVEVELALEPRKDDHGEEVIEIVPVAKIGDDVVDLYSESAQFIDGGTNWLLLHDRTLSSLSEFFSPELVNIFMQSEPLQINAEQQSFFVDNYLLPIARYMPICGSAVEWIESSPAEDDESGGQPRKQIYLTETGSLLLADLHFKYGGISVPYEPTFPQYSIQSAPIDAAPEDGAPIDEATKQSGPIDGEGAPPIQPKLRLARVKREPLWEIETGKETSSASYGLKKASHPNEGRFELRKKVDAIDFLLKKVPNMLRDGYEMFGEDNLKSARVNRNPPSVSMNISSGIDWFDVQPLIKFGDVELQLGEVRKALRQKSRFVKLDDGTIGELPEEWLQRYRHLFQLGEEQDDGIRFSNHHLTLIDQLMSEVDSSQVDAQYTERRNRLRNFEQIVPEELSPNFKGELRPYQKAGFDWLHFLNEFDFGGCLADDMGLGKTVQVLAFLQSMRDKEPNLAADLIVLPKSLLVNWEREAAQFTPNLRTFIHFGQARDKETAHFDEYDLILTTYGIMRSDIEFLREYRFHYVVLDESQAIKTPTSLVSKASWLLQSDHRLAMSGTPVENSTFELWSQFAFLNPGLLGTLDYYKSEFSNPIERHQNEETAELLRKMVYPFILRRTKEQVAPDLPPRTERILYMDMEPAQRNFYEKTRDEYRAQLLGIIEDKGIQGARMKVLEGLLRLRQICNHPKLVKADFRGDSAKMILLMETIKNLAAEGHKALIFSQFVQMLTLVRTELENQKIEYAYLDGQTNKRQDEVDRFQNDPDLKFFLISLKAGGVGLNLTAADYVIHIDPWWNPAVEMQATDRTHRIGQEKPVFVSKMITRNSVEEKILELQQRKQKLVEQLIAAEGSFFKQLTTDDIQVLFS